MNPDTGDDANKESTIEHNFTTSGTDSSFFKINGKLSNDRNGLNYNNLTLTKYLKFEKRTNISFTTEKDCNLKLVFNSDFSKNVTIDGVKHKAINGIVTLKLSSGTHTITKADKCSLYYISVEQ